MRWSASAVAAVTRGEQHGPDVEVDGVEIDSRLLRGGELFVPIVAARDGHDFIDHALESGAAAYLTSRPTVDGTAIVVDDTAAALTALAGDARARLAARVVAVTGSVGKTSTKDFLAAVLGRRWRTAASPRSFNNELGVPLALCNSPADADAVVLEIGARGPGQVAALAELARPSVGVVTCVAAVHTATFGSVEEIARTKAELVEALPADGIAVLNARDARVMAMASRTRARVVTFGVAPDGEDGVAADVTAVGVRINGDLRAWFTLRSSWGSAEVRLSARGEHQVVNALAAAASALALGVPLDDVAVGLGQAALSRWRMEMIAAPSGAVVLNDAYNANPTSVAAALRALAALDARRRVAVLGPMAELGSRSADDHRSAAKLAGELGIRVIAVAAPEYGADDVADIDSALTALGRLGPGDAVLVKGSRVAGLERLVAALLEAEREVRR
jgi:UDP-N-acetylmuramoyl-tripeptide--D-alanyl-D-alanine ligase